MKTITPQAELVSDTEYREQVHIQLMGIQRWFQHELDDLVSLYISLIDP